MGLMDKIKGFFSGPAVQGFVDKVVKLAEEEVVKRAIAKIKEDSEEKAKEKLAEIAADVAKEQLQQIPDPTGIAQKLGGTVIDKATPKIVDKVWDKVKDKIVKKKEGGEAAKPAAPSAGYGK